MSWVIVPEDELIEVSVAPANTEASYVELLGCEVCFSRLNAVDEGSNVACISGEADSDVGPAIEIECFSRGEVDGESGARDADIS